MKILFPAIILFFCTGAFAQNDLEVYPNPFSEEVTLVASPKCGDSLSLEILDLRGRRILKKSHLAFSADTLQYQFPLKAGVFILRYQEDDRVITRRLVHYASRANLKLVLTDDSLSCSDSPFKIYPNPSSTGVFAIEQVNRKMNYEFAIFDVAGNLILREAVSERTSKDHEIDLSKEPKGVYFLRITSAQGTETTRLVIGNGN